MPDLHVPHELKRVGGRARCLWGWVSGGSQAPGLAGGKTVVSVRGRRPAQTLGCVVGGGQVGFSQGLAHAQVKFFMMLIDDLLVRIHFVIVKRGQLQ